MGEIALGSIGLVIIYKSKDQKLKAWRGSLSWVRILLRDSWPLILSGLSVMVYMKIDQVILGEMIDNKAVGIYSAAIRISEVWYFIPMAIVSSVSPSIIRVKKENEGLYYLRLQKLFS